jgi:hypothetical protein
MELKAMILPAAAVGTAAAIVFGIITSIPVLGFFIGFGCCLWSTAAGFAAALLYSRKRKTQLSDAAIVGALTGAIEGIAEPIVVFLIGTLLNLASAGMTLATQGATDAAIRLGISMAGGVFGMVISMFISLFLYTIFGAVGGVLYAATLGKKN